MSIHGTIEDLDNQGTIVQVWVRTDDDRLLPVNNDHRMFHHLADARGLGHLVGAGVPRSVAMATTGHKSEAVYRRYSIVAESNLNAAAAKLATLHESHERGVLPFPKAVAR